MGYSRGKAVVCVACVCLLASGCLVVASKSSSYGPKGAMVSEATLEQIQPGETSKAKLVALLGEPSSKQEVDDDTEIYKYVYSKKTNSCATVFLLFASSDNKEEFQELFFEIRDDLVVDWWKGQEDS